MTTIDIAIVLSPSISALYEGCAVLVDTYYSNLDNWVFDCYCYYWSYKL